ncbi:unnamed protein product [Timema podura]|uniref:Uncharacterized protein n=1 Tax=Timema podura TaxID=61482 RepID=A0ABN7P7Q0_TIMPD|nr:unnamed protein product [Timema podura]
MVEQNLPKLPGTYPGGRKYFSIHTFELKGWLRVSAMALLVGASGRNPDFYIPDDYNKNEAPNSGSSLQLIVLPSRYTPRELRYQSRLVWVTVGDGREWKEVRILAEYTERQ